MMEPSLTKNQNLPWYLTSIRFQRGAFILHVSLYRRYFAGIEVNDCRYGHVKVGVWPLCFMVQWSQSEMNRQVQLDGWSWQ